MKDILLSVRPKWCEKICNEIGKDKNGKPIYEKVIEVRKSKPSEVPCRVLIYQTKSRDTAIYKRYKVDDMRSGKVIGEFICDNVERFSVGSLRSDDIEKLACLSYNEIINYFYKPEELDGKTVKQGFAWHISDLKIYDKPKELSEFVSPSKAKNCVGYCLNGICSNLGYEELCGAIRRCEYKKLTRPPQSYMYVEEV